MAEPMPPEAPVTSTTLPASSGFMRLTWRRVAEMCFPRGVRRLILQQAINGRVQGFKLHHARKHSAVANRVLNEKGRALIHLERMKFRRRGRRSRCDFGRLGARQQFGFI